MVGAVTALLDELVAGSAELAVAGVAGSVVGSVAWLVLEELAAGSLELVALLDELVTGSAGWVVAELLEELVAGSAE